MEYFTIVREETKVEIGTRSGVIADINLVIWSLSHSPVLWLEYRRVWNSVFKKLEAELNRPFSWELGRQEYQGNLDSGGPLMRFQRGVRTLSGTGLEAINVLF